MSDGEQLRRFVVIRGDAEVVADRLTMYQDVGAFVVDANGNPVMNVAVGPDGRLVVLAMVLEDAA